MLNPSVFNVLYVDMNSYFASVEQQADPSLRGKPIAVVPVDADTTACIAASYPAKAFGVRTGTRVGDAKRLCPGLILVQARPDLYVRQHHAILAAIDTVLPVDRVHSIDEVSCRLLGEQRQEPVATGLAGEVKRAIASRVGECLTCSIGLAPNRFLAKVAADMNKPDGLTHLRQAELPGALLGLALTDLPGIGSKTAQRLGAAGVRTMSDLLALDEAGMERAFCSVVGREWHQRLRGVDAHEPASPRRTIGHSHVLSPNRRTRDGARAVGVRLLTKVGARARHLGYVAQHLFLSVSFLGSSRGARGGKWHVRAPLGGVNDAATLLHAFASLWERVPQGTPLKIGVSLADLDAAGASPLLFQQQTALDRLSSAIDRINLKFGANTVFPASMGDARTSAPRRIAFGSIPDLDVPDVSDD
ncbi:MAG: DNA polymerase [Planctomycetota bacterium]|nr:DNA polymerase [Planctomycetota bacterium]